MEIVKTFEWSKPDEIRQPDIDETPLSFDEKMILMNILAHGALND